MRKRLKAELQQVDPVIQAGPTRRYPLAIVLFGASALVLALLIGLRPEVAPLGPGASSALAWLAFAIHIVCCRRTLNSFDPVIWIPVLFLLFHYGMPMAIEWLGAGYLTYDGLDVGEIPPQIDRAFCVILLAMLMYLLGIHLVGFKDLSQRVPIALRDRSSLLGPAMALMLGGAGMSILGVFVIGPGLLFGNYSDMRLANSMGSADFRFFGTGMLFWQAGIFGVLACHDPRRPRALVAGVASAGLLSLLMLATGDRGGLSALVFGAGWIWVIRVRRVPHWLVISGMVFALLLMPIIGEYRSLKTVDLGPVSAREMVEGAIYNMGSATPAVAYTIDIVPRAKPYDWGLTYVTATLQNVPNFGGDVVGWTWGIDPLEHVPSAWFTSTVNPSRWYHRRGGYAFAFIAEWWFNFGLAGVMLGMLATGFATAKLRNSSRTGPLWLVFTALFINMMALVIRNAFAYPMRTVMWPMIGLLVLWSLWPRSRSLARPVPAYAPGLPYAPAELGRGTAARRGISGDPPQQ